MSTRYDVTNIDTTAPTCSIDYDPDAVTSGSVIATLTGCNETITVTNNGGSFSYTFTGNDSFEFEFSDEA